MRTVGNSCLTSDVLGYVDDFYPVDLLNLFSAGFLAWIYQSNIKVKSQLERPKIIHLNCMGWALRKPPSYDSASMVKLLNLGETRLFSQEGKPVEEKVGRKFIPVGRVFTRNRTMKQWWLTVVTTCSFYQLFKSGLKGGKEVVTSYLMKRKLIKSNQTSLEILDFVEICGNASENLSFQMFCPDSMLKGLIPEARQVLDGWTTPDREIALKILKGPYS